MAAEIEIEVVYAMPDAQDVVRLVLMPGATVDAAIERSGLARRHRLSGLESVGIHGRLATRDALLETGDRVEIYRPLLADPKQVRRRRAAAKR